jgi:hypothetical protein
MTSKEFVLWLKGFTQGVHEFNITPKQWDLLKDKLAEVKDEPIGTPIGPGFGVLNTQTFPKWQEPHKVNPFYVGDVPLTNPLGNSGTGTTQGVITTTPGHGTLTYDPSTTTRWNPSGSNWSYTNNTYNPPYTTGGAADDIIKKEENEN